MSYLPCLDAKAFDGTVDKVQIIWGDTAKTRLPKNAQDLGVPVEIIKALTEHYLWACAKRIGCAQVNILGAPHTFTTDSQTGASKTDWNHVSGRLSSALDGGMAQKGRYNVHVYLEGEGQGKAAYDHITVKGERVVQKNNKGPDTLRPDLSIGTYPIDLD